MSSPLKDERVNFPQLNNSLQFDEGKGQVSSFGPSPQYRVHFPVSRRAMCDLQTWIEDPRLETRDYLSTGIDELDRLLQGGVPRGKIVEMMGSVSSGKTSLGLSILAQSTSRGEIAAYVDVVSSFDPKYAQKVGVDLKRLLWIRCANQVEPLRKALKATDILCQAGGFGVIVIDIGINRAEAKIPLNTWFRLQRAVRGTPTVLIVISSQKTTGSASSLVLSVERNRSFWTSGKRSRFVQKPYFQGIESEACLLGGKSHGSVTVYCRF